MLTRQYIRHPLQVILLSVMLFGSMHLAADPWGKDSDMAKKGGIKSPPKQCNTPILGRFGESMIRFHQKVISPADGPRSHFYPCSSQYTLNAMRKYGFFLGFSMGCDRLMRENKDPWIYRITHDSSNIPIKYDPVP